MIGRHASENGIASAVRFFNKKNLKESSVRDWKTLYEKQLKKLIEQARPEDKVVESLATKKRGRPPLLGSTTLDKNLQEIIVSLRSRGTPIGTSVIIGIGRLLLLKHNRSSMMVVILCLAKSGQKVFFEEWVSVRGVQIQNRKC